MTASGPDPDWARWLEEYELERHRRAGVANGLLVRRGGARGQAKEYLQQALERIAGWDGETLPSATSMFGSLHADRTRLNDIARRDHTALLAPLVAMGLPGGRGLVASRITGLVGKDLRRDITRPPRGVHREPRAAPREQLLGLVRLGGPHCPLTLEPLLAGTIDDPAHRLHPPQAEPTPMPVSLADTLIAQLDAVAAAEDAVGLRADSRDAALVRAHGALPLIVGRIPYGFVSERPGRMGSQGVWYPGLDRDLIARLRRVYAAFAFDAVDCRGDEAREAGIDRMWGAGGVGGLGLVGAVGRRELPERPIAGGVSRAEVSLWDLQLDLLIARDAEDAWTAWTIARSLDDSTAVQLASTVGGSAVAAEAAFEALVARYRLHQLQAVDDSARTFIRRLIVAGNAISIGTRTRGS